MGMEGAAGREGLTLARGVVGGDLTANETRDEDRACPGHRASDFPGLVLGIEVDVVHGREEKQHGKDDWGNLAWGVGIEGIAIVGHSAVERRLKRESNLRVDIEIG